MNNKGKNVFNERRPENPFHDLMIFEKLSPERKLTLQTAINNISSSFPVVGKTTISHVYRDHSKLLPKKLIPLSEEMKGKIIGIGGKPQSGKDFAADYLIGCYSNVSKTTFSDNIIPEANRVLNAHGICNHIITPYNKTENMYRELLQEIGLGYREVDPDYWIKRTVFIASNLRERYDLVLITGMRPVDYKQLKELGVILWEVRRPGNNYTASHEIEDSTPEVNPDIVIDNSVEGNLTIYKKQILEALNNINKESN